MESSPPLPCVLSSEFAQMLFSSSPIPVSVYNSDGNIIYCSQSFLDYFEVQNKEEYIARLETFSPLTQANGQRSLACRKEYMQKALAEGQCRFQWTHQISFGELRTVEYTIVRTTYQEQTFISCYLNDIDRILTTLEEQKNEAVRAQTLLDASPFSISFWTKSFQPMDCNQETLKLFKFKDKDDFLQNAHQIFPKYQPNGTLSRHGALDALDYAFQTGTCQLEWTYTTLEGEPLLAEATLKRVYYLGQELLALYLRDLREVRSTEEKVRAAEARTQAMLDSFPIGVVLFDKQFAMRDCNQEALRLVNIRSKQSYIKNYRNFLPEKQPCGNLSETLLYNYLSESFEDSNKSIEWLLIDTDKNPLPLALTFIRVQVNNEPMIACYHQDLRALKASQKQAHAAEARTQAMLDSFPMCATFINEDFSYLDCNLEAAKLFGFSCKNDYLTNFHQMHPATQADGTPSLEAFNKKITLAFMEGFCHFEWVCRHSQTHDPIPVDIIFVRIKHDDHFAVIGYFRDLREHKAMLKEIFETEKKLRLARDIAEQSTKTKGEFLANMSHEIRTPMNGILGILQLLSETELLPKQKNFVQKALLSANNLLRIINDILDFSKIESGRLIMENIPFTMDDICQELQALYGLQIKQKNLQLTIEAQTLKNITLVGDPLRLKQVLFNLVSNAIKFTEKGGITVKAEATKQSKNEIHCVFSVSDTGIGLNDEEAARLFSAFTQADTSVTRKYGGTGLGLVISKRIVKIMGGEIGLKSTKGEGSTFYFSTIFTHSKPSQGKKTQEEQRITTSIADALVNEYILLVEDNDINQLIAEELLKATGYKVDIAHNGKEAIEMLAKKPYDLVLMDIQMPIMDGLTATKHIRTMEQYAALPIIAMSAHAMTGDKEISLAHGMNDHLTKPISADILYKTLRYWLKKQ